MTTPAEKDAMALAVLDNCCCILPMFAALDGLNYSRTDLIEARAHLASRISELEADNENLFNRLIDERHDREKIIRRYAEQLQHEVQHQRAINEQLTKHLISGAAFLPPAPMIIAADAAALLDRATRAEAELAAVRVRLSELQMQWRHNAQGCGRRDQQAAGAWRSCARDIEAAIDAARGGE